MNVYPYNTTDYEIFIPLAGQKNKPNSNPNKPNFRKAKMNVNLTLTKDYRKKDDFLVRINKPNFRNGQNERKLTYNKGLQKKRCFHTPKNKPNSNPILSAVGGFQNELKITCRKIRLHPVAWAQVVSNCNYIAGWVTYVHREHYQFSCVFNVGGLK